MVLVAEPTVAGFPVPPARRSLIERVVLVRRHAVLEVVELSAEPRLAIIPENSIRSCAYAEARKGNAVILGVPERAT